MKDFKVYQTSGKLNKLVHYASDVRTRMLPEEYELAEYLESVITGTEQPYINTGISDINGVIFKIKMCYISFPVNVYQIIAGAEDSSVGTSRNSALFVINNKLSAGPGIVIESDITPVINEIYEIETKTINDGDDYLKINGEIAATGQNTSVRTSYPIFLFNLNKAGATGAQYRSHARIYYCKLYASTGVLVRDFVPCVRITDGECGLFDFVSNSFYENQGTGSFITNLS